jgi:hypothetical protein
MLACYRTLAVGRQFNKGIELNYYWEELNHFIYSSMAVKPFVGPWPLLQFRNFFTQTVRLLGRVISPSQGRYLHTE